MKSSECQSCSLSRSAKPIVTTELLRQRLNRLKMIIKRRCRYIVNWVCKIPSGQSQSLPSKAKNPTIGVLKAGDLVRVRSREEIQATLNNWNQLKGCAFMDEMWSYCGTTQRVFKRVERFLDERDYLVKRCKGIVLLEGLICEGTKAYGPCDRSCFYFWREEWLERIQ